MQAFIKNVTEFIHTHTWVNQLLQLLLLIGVGFAIYFFFVGKRLKKLQNIFPFLQSWVGDSEIRHLTKVGEFAKAGDLLIEKEQFEEAAMVFERGRLFGRAADIYLRLELPMKAIQYYEKAGEHEKAAQLCLDLKHFDRAERNFEQANLLPKIGDIYLSRGLKELAINAFQKNGQISKAAQVLGELGRWEETGKLLLKTAEQARKETLAMPNETTAPEVLRQLKKAAQAYAKAQHFAKAAQVFVEAKELKLAADAFIQSGNRKKAAEIFQELGELERAASLLAQDGDPVAALRLEGEQLLQNGELQEAIGKFQKAGDFFRAGDIYQDLQESEKAALMYEKANEFALAASLYREEGQLQKAGVMYEKAELWGEAIDCFQRANLPERELLAWEKKGDGYGLAGCLHRQGMLKEALDALEKIPEQHPDFRSALSLKGKIFLDQGDPFKAKELFSEAIADLKQLESSDLDTIYNLAVASEKADGDTSAVEILERMLAEGMVENSAIEKAKNVRKILSDRAFTRLSHLKDSTSGSDVFAKSEEAITQEATAPQVQRYRKMNEIGRGGMGIVYTAKDSTLDRVVALKILSSALRKNEQAVKTFLREAKAAASLNHPYIVTVHDAGTQQGDLYIAMELIDGKTIKEIIRSKGKLSYTSTLVILKQLLEALNYAHSRNVVHRDLTTSNIMWTKQKSIKIMDFGLAKIITELLSEQSIVGGTPSFMSPEQTVGDPIDHRTDIYSLGICIYEMCLGVLPFTKGDMGFHHIHTPPPIPKQKDPKMPQAFNDIILKCMEKKPENRFQKVEEIQEIIKNGL